MKSDINVGDLVDAGTPYTYKVVRIYPCSVYNDRPEIIEIYAELIKVCDKKLDYPDMEKLDLSLCSLKKIALN